MISFLVYGNNVFFGCCILCYFLFKISQCFFLAIKKTGKRKPKWNLDKIKSKEVQVLDVIEEKFSLIDGVTSSLEDSRRKVKETV